MPSPIWGAAPSFITMVQVIPALISTPGGTWRASVNGFITNLNLAKCTYATQGKGVI
jgi:hypothetical protein